MGSFVSVTAGDRHSCGLRSDGSVACWGSDEDGRATPPAGSFDSVSALVNPMDDHGNDFESATRIAIGEAVAVELEDLDDRDVLAFRARPDTEYVLTTGTLTKFGITRVQLWISTTLADGCLRALMTTTFLSKGFGTR